MYNLSLHDSVALFWGLQFRSCSPERGSAHVIMNQWLAPAMIKMKITVCTKNGALDGTARITEKKACSAAIPIGTRRAIHTSPFA